ncbi:MFS transporter [Streptomyces cylindrosporus]|uniref:MFS transporter n=1 Tax=Streptomyces cylindrosporus TaxID=2927583 RepID=A0ABS9YJ33_9ACTN|nr:MFS transporter [Streptomyces cylindrosporus]MCI3277194.1 MFS transporter [Streptomyces cylindrosporus]
MRGLRDIPRPIWLLAGGTFVNMVVSVSFAYTFLYLTGPRALDTAEAGILSGAAGLGLLAGNFTGGWYGDHFGHRRVLLASAALSGLTLLAVPALPTPALFAALPLAQYLSGTQRASSSALVATTVPEGSRRQAFALMRAASNGGFTLGPILGALVATHFSYDWLYVAEGAGSLGLACWTARVVRAPAVPKRVEASHGSGLGGVWPALRARPAVLVLLPSIVVIDVVYRQQYSTFPVFLADHGMDAQVYGSLLAINGGMLLCLELPLALGLRRRSPLRIVGTGLLLVAGGYGALLLGAGVVTAAVMMALLTLGEALYKTTATAYVADQAPPHVQGRFQSLYAGASISGVVLSAPLGGALYEAAPNALWPLCAILGALAAAAVLLSARGRTATTPAPAPDRSSPETPPHPVSLRTP